VIQAMVIKGIIKAVIKAIEKVPDKKIASNHEQRILKLEKDSHPKKEFKCRCKCQK